jgi:hypothetical protein
MLTWQMLCTYLPGALRPSGAACLEGEEASFRACNIGARCNIVRRDNLCKYMVYAALAQLTTTMAVERTEYSKESGRTNLAKLLNQDLSQVYSICHLSRGAVKIEGISLHSGRTKVPGNTPMSFGRSANLISWVLVLKDGCTWLGGRKFICLPRHCWEVSEKARH